MQTDVARTPVSAPLPPYAPEDFPYSHAIEFRRDVLGMMERCAGAGPLVRLRVPGLVASVTADPEGFKRILVDDVRHYSKQTRGFAELRNVLGNGLLTSEGDFWLRQRRLMQPSFHREPLGRFAEPIVRVGERLARRWLGFARTGHPFELVSELMAVALELVGGTLLGSDVTGDTEVVGRSMETVLEVTQRRLGWPFRTSIETPLPGNLRLLAARERVRGIALRLVREARDFEGRGDLVSVLVRARDPETGDQMTDEQLRDEVLTMLAAGHETTANALTWTLHLLTQHPEEEARVLSELATELGSRSPTLEDLPRLARTQMALKEAMRLYPPAWTVARMAEREDELFGYRITKGSHVFGSIYAMHRRPDLYPDPLRFDPSRFEPEQERTRPRLAYLPFGAGPHLCIGQPFAMLEGTLLLATVLPHVKLLSLDRDAVVPDPKITLRPRGGLHVVASAR